MVTPTPKEPDRAAEMKQRIRDTAEDKALNAAAVVKDRVRWFQGSSRFFKYKVAIGVAYAAILVATLAVARPDSLLTGRNALDARLLQQGEPSRRVYLVFNEGDDVWEDAEVVFNGRYIAREKRVDPLGGKIAVTPKILRDDQGKRPPKGFVVRDIQVRTRDGSAWLLKDGQAP